jgi:hypothetical protein
VGDGGLGWAGVMVLFKYDSMHYLSFLFFFFFF